MAGISGNPFGAPVENLFADPSIQNASRQPNAAANATSALEGYNPFADDGRRPVSVPVRGASNPPPLVHSTGAPPAYSSSAAQGYDSQPTRTLPGHDELLRRQEELEAKAAELKRKEEELQRQQMQDGGGGIKNWPPLPKWFPMTPCFYHDINVEIPQMFQQLMKQIYYLWILYAATLLLNVIGSLAYFVCGGSGPQFGFSIIQCALFTPCSFLMWYRPVYKAFRNDSSFNFMIFFFVMFLQLVFITIQALGLSSFGTCGWFNTLGEFSTNVGAGLIMFIVTIGFTVSGVGMLLALFKVHRIYRSTGASFAKAQEEFSHGIISNPSVQSAAVNVATSAVQNRATGGRF